MTFDLNSTVGNPLFCCLFTAKGCFYLAATGTNGHILATTAIVIIIEGREGGLC